MAKTLTTAEREALVMTRANVSPGKRRTTRERRSELANVLTRTIVPKRYRPYLDSARLLGRALSPRETQVCAMVSQGMKNKEIAYALSISEGCVKIYVFNAMAKRGLRNRVEMALDYISNISKYRLHAIAD